MKKLSKWASTACSVVLAVNDHLWLFLIRNNFPIINFMCPKNSSGTSNPHLSQWWSLFEFSFIKLDYNLKLWQTHSSLHRHSMAHSLIQVEEFREWAPFMNRTLYPVGWRFVDYCGTSEKYKRNISSGSAFSSHRIPHKPEFDLNLKKSHSMATG